MQKKLGQSYKYLLVLLVLVFSVSCLEKSDSADSCDRASKANSLTQKLKSISTDSDYSLLLKSEDGTQFEYNSGAITKNTLIESASTSKWVTAAIILWAVENTSGFELTDKIGDHYNWGMNPGDSLNSARLSDLLSFTSGLKNEPNCLKLGIPVKTFEDCIKDGTGSVVSENEAQGFQPGQSFYYSSAHMQIAGAMTVAALNEDSWQGVFSRFQSSTGLFLNSEYSLPSTNNPRLAGGMKWTGSDYLDFLQAIYKKTFLSDSSLDRMFSNQLTNVSIEYSPANEGLGENWRYGYGVWLQCNSSDVDCTNVEYYSSPGAYGAYPFVNFNKKFYGVLVRQGSLGSFTKGIAVVSEAQSEIESWARCE